MMEKSERTLRLVIDQINPDNDVRRRAELEFDELSHQDPSRVMVVLLELAVNEEVGEDVRQTCLMNIKQLVPKFWSMGFQSFIGPAVNQEVKQHMRKNLFQLATTSPSSKIRSGSAYVIVQIAASDYPDEWPDLISSLYLCTKDFRHEIAVVGGLDVFHQLYDDLITDDQFWEGGIGSELINHLANILGQEGAGIEVKLAASDLYRSILDTLHGPQAYDTAARKHMAMQHMDSSVVLFTTLLGKEVSKEPRGEVSLPEFKYRYWIYNSLVYILGLHNKRVPQETKKELASLSMKDFTGISDCHHRVVGLDDNSVKVVTTAQLNDPTTTISNTTSAIIDLLNLLQNSFKLSEEANSFEQLLQNILICGLLPLLRIERYELDFNTFVTDVNEVSSEVTVRYVIREFLTELNGTDALCAFNWLISNFSSEERSWQQKECFLYIIESLFMNEELENFPDDTPAESFYHELTKFIPMQTRNYHCLVTSRCFLMLPKFIEKFSSRLQVQEVGTKALVDMLSVSANCPSEECFAVIKVACLISCTFYKLLLNFGDQKFASAEQIQTAILQIILSLIDDGEEDTLPALLEGLIAAIEIDHESAVHVRIDGDKGAIDILLQVGFKVASDNTLYAVASECLETLLSKVGYQNYIIACEKCLPFLLDQIRGWLDKSGDDYTSELDLALELLGVTVKSLPEGEELPKDIFNFIFPVLDKLIFTSSDNQILQGAGGLLGHLLDKASKLFLDYTGPECQLSGVDMLLSSVSKFLSPTLSDSAAVNCGTIVLTFINKFQGFLSFDFLTQMLETTIKRLVLAKEVITIENLIMVFCNLVSSSPQEMINFLGENIRLVEPDSGQTKSGLEIVLPIWFQSFEITRGYEKIKQSALALARIFTLNDARVQSLVVNGDLIPYEGDLIRTRSMTKAMPDEYTQISASQKILKLLISELNFQCQQPSADGYLPSSSGAPGSDSDEEDWEEIEDLGVPNFDKLKSYVDSDEEDDQHEDEDGDEELKNILTQFFKECTTRNLGNFQTYYELLNDDEKKILTECLLF